MCVDTREAERASALRPRVGPGDHVVDVAVVVTRFAPTGSYQRFDPGEPFYEADTVEPAVVARPGLDAAGNRMLGKVFMMRRLFT